jgi:hypothetical protein
VHLSSSTECAALRVNPDVVLWSSGNYDVIKMSQMHCSGEEANSGGAGPVWVQGYVRNLVMNLSLL